MRSFQEGVDKKIITQPSTAPLALDASNRAAPPALYPTLIAIAVVVMIVVFNVTIAMTAGSYTAVGAKYARAVVIVAPGMGADVFEAAVTSGKAGIMGSLVSTGGASLGRLTSNTTDPAAALATLLTGTPISFHNVTNASVFAALRNGAQTFLQVARAAELRPVVVGPASAFSNGTLQSTNGQCSQIGVLDAECGGVACVAAGGGSCNAMSRLALCAAGGAAGEIVDFGTSVPAIALAAVSQGYELAYAQTNAFATMPDASATSLQALSAVSTIDGVVGQLAVAAASRSATAGEAWLLLVVGDGANAQQQAPFFAAVFSEGKPVPLRAPSAAANIADAFATVVSWLGLVTSPSVVGVPQGICTSGAFPKPCV